MKALERNYKKDQVGTWKGGAEDYTPEYTDIKSRTYFQGKIADVIGQSLGHMAMNVAIADPWYYTISGAAKNLGATNEQIDDTFGLTLDMINEGEDELGRALFRMDPTEKETYVFDMVDGGTANVAYISQSPKGQAYQSFLNKQFTEHILSLYDDPTNWRKDSIQINPDTGRKGMMFETPVLGDVFVGKDGKFFDYWNIGLDKKENYLLDYSNLSKLHQLPSARLTNLKRLVAAPYTSPPTVFGAIDLDEEMIKLYLEKLHTDMPQKYYQIEEQILKQKLTPSLFKGELMQYLNRVIEN